MVNPYFSVMQVSMVNPYFSVMKVSLVNPYFIFIIIILDFHEDETTGSDFFF